MIKFLLKATILIFSIHTTTFADIIREIDVSGNKRISKNTIMVLGNIKLNEDFDNSKLNEALKKLYQTNFFSNITLTTDNGILNIDIGI